MVPPLKIRGGRGVMKSMGVTPFVPPYPKGEIQVKREYWHLKLAVPGEWGKAGNIGPLLAKNGALRR
jgi:hypothetical protein